MRAIHVAATRALWMGLLVICFSSAPLSAQQFGIFTCVVEGGTVKITGCPKDTVGAIEIPAVIDGKPVTAIGDWAFADHWGLTSVVIPGSVTSIGYGAFLRCRRLTAIETGTLNPNYSSLDGVLFDKSRSTLIQFPGGKAGPYAIPSGVTAFGENAFSDCRGLTAVSIPDGVDSMPAFYNCTRLASVSIPDTVTSIGSFYGCAALTNILIPGSVVSIGESAFENCKSLASISIPDSVTSIGRYAFLHCSSLTAIEVGDLNPNFSSLDGVLFDKNRSTLIRFPEGKAGPCAIPNGVTAFDELAFFGCTGMTAVTIPASLTSIPEFAFANCTALASISLPDSVTSVGGYAFFNCTSLTSVAIPAGITGIGGATFKGCTGLASVTIPNSVATIYGNAFEGCTGLTSLILPDSLTVIGFQAFKDCTSLKSIAIPDDVAIISEQAFIGCTSLASLTIGSGVTTVGYSTFEGCVSLTNVTIPDGVTLIDDSAFERCTGLTSVSIGSGVTKLGWYAFAGCSALTSITIPQNLTVIGYQPFLGCTGLTAIEVSPLNLTYSSLDGVLFNKPGTSLVKFPSMKAGGYAVPSTVIALQAGAFESCKALTSISIPGSVVWIGGRTFKGCTALTSVSIPDSLTFIDYEAFQNCTGLTSISIGRGLTDVGSRAFNGCTALSGFTVDVLNSSYSSLDGVLFDKSRSTLIQFPGGRAGAYSIPNTVTTVGYDAFGGCTGLTSGTIPGSVKVINSGAFHECTGLASISIPNSVTSIGDGTFYGCTGLTSVSMGRGLSDIGYQAFYGCTNLTEFSVDALNPSYRSMDGALFDRSPFRLVQFPAQKGGDYSVPDGVAEIGYIQGDDPFDRCTKLTSVSIPASVASISTPVFSGCSSLTSINVDPLNPKFSSLNGVLYLKDPLILYHFPTVWFGIYNVPDRLESIFPDAFSGNAGLRAVVFQGDAPDGIYGGDTFGDVAAGFTIYYFRGNIGFTSPTWNGYPAIMIDQDNHPAAEWLLGHGLPWDSDLHQDLNSDGVSLLVAYALNLDPNLDLTASLPMPLLGADDLSVSFHGVSPGIIYVAETSTNLTLWTTNGVSLSPPDSFGQRTASVPRDGPVRFLRLSVGD